MSTIVTVHVFFTNKVDVVGYLDRTVGRLDGEGLFVLKDFVADDNVDVLLP